MYTICLGGKEKIKVTKANVILFTKFRRIMGYPHTAQYLVTHGELLNTVEAAYYDQFGTRTF
jgi:hypothetical protein